MIKPNNFYCACLLLCIAWSAEITAEQQSADVASPDNFGICEDSPPLGDGWGWDGVQSCRLEAQNVAGECVDTTPVNDGWGWNGVESCRVAADVETDCVDSPPLGDGWGWDGTQSCTIEGDVTAGACVDSPPLGNGWGWDGVQSCAVDRADNVLPGNAFRVALRDNGRETNYQTTNVHVSTDARFALFSSYDNNIVVGDTNGFSDVFFRDTLNGSVSRINLGADGEQANNQSEAPQISADGRYLLFASYATNLASGVTNGSLQLHRYDTQTGDMQIISVNDSGELGRGNSSGAKISSDGRYIAYVSRASNLVPDDRNSSIDVFLYDTDTAQVVRVSNGSYGDGNLMDMSADGRFIMFSDFEMNNSQDNLGAKKVYIHDTFTNTTTPLASDIPVPVGAYIDRASSGAISDDGRYAVYGTYSSISNTYQIYWHARDTGEVKSVGHSTGNDYSPDISPDGHHVAFESRNWSLADASQVADDQRNIYLRDMLADDVTIKLVSKTYDGTVLDGHSLGVEFTPDGKHVGFRSSASRLVENDNNGVYDYFVVRVLP